MNFDFEKERIVAGQKIDQSIASMKENMIPLLKDKTYMLAITLKINAMSRKTMAEVDRYDFSDTTNQNQMREKFNAVLDYDLCSLAMIGLHSLLLDMGDENEMDNRG